MALTNPSGLSWEEILTLSTAEYYANAYVTVEDPLFSDRLWARSLARVVEVIRPPGSTDPTLRVEFTDGRVAHVFGRDAYRLHDQEAASLEFAVVSATARVR